MNQNLAVKQRTPAQVIQNVYHILPSTNLFSVCMSGLYNRNTMNKRHYTDYSDQDVQKIRSGKRLGHYPLHDYVCTFLNPQNKMSYRYQKENRNFVIIQLSTKTLLEYNWFLSVRNAACQNATFFYKDENAIDCALIRKIKSREKGQTDLKMSEILFFTQRIHPHYISKIILHPKDQIEPYYSLMNRGFEFMYDSEYHYYCPGC